MTNLDTITTKHVLVLGDGVGDHDSLEVRAVDPVQRLAREDAVRQDGVDLLRPLLYQFLSSLQMGQDF